MDVGTVNIDMVPTRPDNKRVSNLVDFGNKSQS